MTRTCPECGEDFAVDPSRRGRTPTYCSRACQVRNLNRRRSGSGGRIMLVIDDESRRVLDQAAHEDGVTTLRYVELIVADHVDQLISLRTTEVTP